MGQVIRYQTTKIRQTLDELSMRGLIIRKRIAGARVLYKLNWDKQDEIHRILETGLDQREIARAKPGDLPENSEY